MAGISPYFPGRCENRGSESEAPTLRGHPHPFVFSKEEKQVAQYGDALREDHFSEKLIRASVTFWSKMHKWLRC
jgi:hypothetical protein